MSPSSTSRSSLSIRKAVLYSSLAILGAWGACLPLPGTEQRSAATKPPSVKTGTEGLEAAGARLAEILIKGDAREFLAECSKKGVVFWADGGPVPLPQMKKAFETKTGIYCLLFDTKCLGQMKGFEGQSSLRDRLKRSPSFHLRAIVDAELGPGVGEITIAVGEEKSPGKSADLLSFIYVQENKTWKLANAENY